jgi:hypothetical protein
MSTQGTYEDKVDVIGEVLAADVVRRTAWVRVNGTTKVRLSFSPEQEDVVTQALVEHRTSWLRITGRGEFSRTGQLKRVTQADRLGLQVAIGAPSDQPHRPIEEVIQEIMADVPEEDWARVPADLSDNVDHYVYGLPKR